MKHTRERYIPRPTAAVQTNLQPIPWDPFPLHPWSTSTAQPGSGLTQSEGSYEVFLPIVDVREVGTVPRWSKPQRYPMGAPPPIPLGTYAGGAPRNSPAAFLLHLARRPKEIAKQPIPIETLLAPFGQFAPIHALLLIRQRESGGLSTHLGLVFVGCTWMVFAVYAADATEDQSAWRICLEYRLFQLLGLGPFLLLYLQHLRNPV